MNKALLVKQRDATDCGAACIASLCAYYNLKVPVARIRQYANTGLQGTSVLGIIEATRKLGMDSKGVKGAFSSLYDIPLPAIAHLVISGHHTHFAVIVRVSQKDVLIMDPAEGKFKKILHDEFKAIWTGILILAIPGEDFQVGTCVSNISRFWDLARPQQKRLFQALGCALIVSFLGLSISVYVQRIIDEVLMRGDLHLMKVLSVTMILLLVFQVGAGFLKDILALRTAQHIDARLVLGYYKHLLHLPQRFFDTMKVGEIMSRINDAVRISSFISSVATNILLSALIVFFSLVIMFMYYWKLALIAVAMLPVYLFLAYMNDRVNKKWQRRVMESFAGFDTQLVQNLTAAATLKRYCLEHYAMDKTENKFRGVLEKLYRSSVYQLYLSGSAEFITRVFTIVILWAGSYFVVRKYLSAGELLSFYALMSYFTTPLMHLADSSGYIRESLTAADRLFEIMDLEQEKNGDSVLRLPEEQQDGIRFHDVHFAYDNAEKLLSGLNCAIRKNSITGITGQSGSGKSTLGALLQKLYEPTKGKITIDRADIREINNESLRNTVMVVPQQGHLFSASIAENIAIGSPEPDMNKVLELSERLGITDFSSQFPEGLNTVLHEQANNLSGGQKQRISVARALYRNPPILVLDEATASLDKDSEKKVLDTLQWYRLKGNTIVIITHSDAALQICDRILALEDGSII